MHARIQDPPFEPARVPGLSAQELHALHLDSLGGDGRSMAPAMALALQASFGSVERWREEFTAMAKAPGLGSGWVLLSFLPAGGILAHQRCADAGPSRDGAVALLALDLRALAGGGDPALAVGPRVDAFMNKLDWGRVYARYQHAVEASSEALAATEADLAGAQLLDVRRAAVFEQSDSMIPGAVWRDPAAVGQWAATLAPDEPVLVYCVYGHEVGRATAMRLRAAGLKARFLVGGIDGWTRAGQPLQAKGAAA